MKKVAFIAIALAMAFMAVPAMAYQGPPGHHEDENDCGEYCWLGFITPVNANVNFADIDTDIDTTAFTGGNHGWLSAKIDDIKFGEIGLNAGSLSVTSGKANAYSTLNIAANMIEPLACNGCADSGIYANVNVALIDNNIETAAKSGFNKGSLANEIEDISFGKATLNGGVATVTSDAAWASTDTGLTVNLIGDWGKILTPKP